MVGVERLHALHPHRDDLLYPAAGSELAGMGQHRNAAGSPDRLGGFRGAQPLAPHIPRLAPRKVAVEGLSL